MCVCLCVGGGHNSRALSPLTCTVRPACVFRFHLIQPQAKGARDGRGGSSSSSEEEVKQLQGESHPSGRVWKLPDTLALTRAQLTLLFCSVGLCCVSAAPLSL